MDAVRSATDSIEAVNKLLEAANRKVLDTVEKQLKVTVEMALGVEAGKGEYLDVVA